MLIVKVHGICKGHIKANQVYIKIEGLLDGKFCKKKKRAIIKKEQYLIIKHKMTPSHITSHG